MQTRHSNSCSGTKGPEMFYGYCHESRRMRMMDYPDYMTNLQQGYSGIYQNPSSALQQMVDMATATSAATATPDPRHKHHHGCGCHEEKDCSCNCCIRCADTVQYAYCGETRKIAITFDNDSRRERQVNVQVGGFLTDSGQQLPWKASITDTQFTLPPCGEKTVMLTVTIDCGQTNPDGNNNPDTGVVGRVGTAVDSCKVGYLKVTSDGCLIRPLIVAVAVLPDHCGAHKVGCLCGCC